ncbi:hypothetical protein BDV09DRAFT_195408 [Aspergillus tetrazonus]
MEVSHIPTLNFLADYFQITYLCDISTNALEHCRRKVAGASPKITKSAEALCSSSEVDAVLVCNATPYHTEHAILALKNDKSVLVEKPLTSSYGDIERLQAAERTSKGRLMVGYMRRYAPGFLDAVAEIGGISQILYARVRDIIGPNAAFVEQSGTFPKRFDDYSPEEPQALKDKDRSAADEALASFGVPVNDETRRMLMVLGGLGTHNLSAMREAIGMPQIVKSAVLKLPIWTATFDYGAFPVVYESGINQVPVFDAHIEVYGPDKIVRVNYDTPYHLLRLNYSFLCLFLLSASDGYDGTLMNGLQALPRWQAFMNNPTGAWLGFVNAVQTLSAFILYPVVAWCSDRYGRKTTLGISFSGSP